MLATDGSVDCGGGDSCVAVGNQGHGHEVVSTRTGVCNGCVVGDNGLQEDNVKVARKWLELIATSVFSCLGHQKG